MQRLPILLLFAALGCASLPAPSRHAIAQVDRGARLLEAGALDDAEASYRLALEYDPHVAAAHVGLAIIAAVRGDLEEATTRAQAALDLEEDNLEAHLAFATITLARSDREATERWLEAALRIDPGCVEARMALAALLYARSAHAEARAHALRVLQRTPDDADALVLLASCELALGRPNEAMRRARRAIALAPTPLAHMQLALGAVAAGRNDVALRAVELALGGLDHASPDDADLRESLTDLRCELRVALGRATACAP